MSFAKITAIVRRDRIESIENELHRLGAPGLTLSAVKGYGNYADFYRNDWMVSHIRCELFIAASRAEGMAEAIMRVAHTGVDGDGLVAIEPVSHIYHIRTLSQCTDDAC